MSRVSVQNVLQLAQYCSSQRRCEFVFNLAAPFVMEVFKDPMLAMLPMTNYLIGNREEFETLARVHGLLPPEQRNGEGEGGDAGSDLDRAHEICRGALSLMTKGQSSSDGSVKVVVMTRGEAPVIYCEHK